MDAAGDDVKNDHATQSKNNPNSLLIVTSSGQLPCKRIFFSQWKPNQDESILRQSIIDFVWNVIQNAMQYQCTSIALPAIGCGQFGFPADVIAKTMMKEVKHQIQNRKLSLNIRFVIKSDQQAIYDEFCNQVGLILEGQFLILVFIESPTLHASCQIEIESSFDTIHLCSTALQFSAFGYVAECL